MKHLSTLLALFLLILTLSPCDDAIDADNCVNEVHYHTGDQSDHGPEADFCSPFCQCNCCHTNIVDHSSIEMVIQAPSLDRHKPDYSNNLGMEFTHSLLRPPRA